MGVIDFSNRQQNLRRGDKIEMLVMYCGEIIKIAPYQWDDFSFENVEYLDFQSQGMKLRKKQTACRSLLFALSMRCAYIFISSWQS